MDAWEMTESMRLRSWYVISHHWKRGEEMGLMLTAAAGKLGDEQRPAVATADGRAEPLAGAD